MRLFFYKNLKQVAQWGADFVPSELRRAIKNRLKAELKADLKDELKADLKDELKAELKDELKAELKDELKAELKDELPGLISLALQRQTDLIDRTAAFKRRVESNLRSVTDENDKSSLVERLSSEWRVFILEAAGLQVNNSYPSSMSELLQEFSFLRLNQTILAPVFQLLAHKRVLFAGQAYYNAWYLSRALREKGWQADVLNWDMNPSSQIYYHGEDFAFDGQSNNVTEQMLEFYLSSLYLYDIFHFSNAFGISFGWPVQDVMQQNFEKFEEIFLLKGLGKKIVYSNNGCMDGVSQTAFSKWGPESVCSICRWRNEPSVCSDARNLEWGKFRNSVADYQCTLGGNRADYNDAPTVHEVPEFYCLDKDIWHPQIQIPDKFLLPAKPEGTVWLYHAVGHKAERTDEDGVNIKSSHVYLPLVEKLKEQGYQLELLEPTGIPNKEVRFLQVQADIFLDMLTFGWFGANAREAMMLGKPVICYIRPEWLESLRKEIPEYADDLPIISATPYTIEAVLCDLIVNPEKRREIGERSRQFALKWHSAEAGGRRLSSIYEGLLKGDPQLLVKS
jgi:hypothetical protein